MPREIACERLSAATIIIAVPSSGVPGVWARLFTHWRKAEEATAHRIGRSATGASGGWTQQGSFVSHR